MHTRKSTHKYTPCVCAQCRSIIIICLHIALHVHNAHACMALVMEIGSIQGMLNCTCTAHARAAGVGFTMCMQLEHLPQLGVL